MLDASMKCGDVTYAESLFNKPASRDLAMYATMMKGLTSNMSQLLTLVFLSRLHKEQSSRTSNQAFQTDKKTQ